MKHTGEIVNDDTYSAPIQAFKSLCLEEGDYSTKKNEEDITPTYGRRTTGLQYLGKG